MRKKQKHFSRLLFGVLGLLLIGITFGSCEAEKDFAEESANGKINYVKIEDVPFLIPTIQNFNHDYDYLTNPILSDARREDLNLNLDLEHIIQYVYDNGLKTYSIKINEEFEEYEDKYFENLNIYKVETDYKSFVTKYNPLDDTIEFDINTFTGDLEIYDKDLNYQGVVQFENGERRCHKIIHGGWHIWIHNGTIDIWFVPQENETHDPNNNSYNFPDPSYPQYLFIANDGYQSGAGEALEEPCVQLKQKTEQPIFNSKLSYLNNQEHFDLDHETGYFENKNSLGGVIYSYVTAPPGTHNLRFSQPCYGFIHVHQNDYYVDGVLKHTVKIFSPQDIYAFIFNCQSRAAELGLSASDTYAIMTSSEGTYAMKILTPTVTANATTEFWNNFRNDYLRKSEKLIKDNNLNPVSIQKMFLEFLKEKGLYNNIGLYKATNADLTSWNRLIIEDYNVTETPCN